MINLLRAETSRAFSRRVVWFATLLAFAGCLLAFYGNSYSIRPVGEAERASATQAYEDHKRDWDQNKERYCGGNPQCMDSPPNLDGEVGNKKQYDPRAWGKAAEDGMAKRIVEACQQLRSAGTSLSA